MNREIEEKELKV